MELLTYIKLIVRLRNDGAIAAIAEDTVVERECTSKERNILRERGIGEMAQDLGIYLRQATKKCCQLNHLKNYQKFLMDYINHKESNKKEAVL